MLTLLATAALIGGDETYLVDHLDPPAGVILEVGGMDWLDAERLVVSTRRGQVWIVENALDPAPAAARFRLFAEGLQEGLGLKVVDGEIYVLQRAELSRLGDTDDDGVCDTIDTISNDFGVSGNYHEFAFGLPQDTAGNFCIALNLGFTDPKWWHGRSLAPWRGWVLKIAPDGTTTPFASGFRSPCGIGTNAVGDLFVTDNQGDWMPACPLMHVQEGGFYGAPASLVWTQRYREARVEPSITNPVDEPRVPPACWIPYKWSRSTGDMRPAPKDGSFGPFEDQLILAELTNGLVFRADLELVRGEYQGALMLLREKVGSAVRTLFAPDGTLFLGLTNRGWGGLAPGHGIARLRWNKITPFEMKHVRVLQDGFRIEFTAPLATDASIVQEDIDVSLYHYDWWWEYGSPERDDGKRVVTQVDIAPDRNSLTFRAPIEAGHMVRVVLKNVRSEDGRPLAHDEFNYTLNQLPEGEPCTTPIARVAPPPPARAEKWEGWLRLTYGDAFDMWREHNGWGLVDAEFSEKDPGTLALRDGYGALVYAVEAPRTGVDMISMPHLGDAQVHLNFMVAEGATAGVRIHERYSIDLGESALGGNAASREQSAPRPGIPAHYARAGLWHELKFGFRAARFGPDGTKTENARATNLTLDGLEFLPVLEFTGDGIDPSNKPLRAESASGPIALIGANRRAAYGDVRVKPVLPERIGDWKALLDDDGLVDWRTAVDSKWKREDGRLTNGGAAGRIVSPRLDYRDFSVHLRAKISAGGMAHLFLRAPESPQAAGGIGVRFNASHPDSSRTGSIVLVEPRPDDGRLASRVIAARKAGLVGEDTWFDMVATVRTRATGGTDVSVELNGAVINTTHITSEHPLSGAIALDVGQDGSLLEIETLAAQDLSAPANDPAPPRPR